MFLLRNKKIIFFGTVNYVISHAFSHLIFFQNPTFSQSSFRNTVRVSNRLYPQIAGPDLGLNCLQKLSADGTSRHRVTNER